MFKNLATLILLLSAYILSAQDCNNNLSGKVFDFHDNSLLAGALVYVQGLEISVMSDVDGNYNLQGLCDGTYKMIISHPECDPIYLDVEIQGNTVQDFLLEHHIEELEEVKVVGEAAQKSTTGQEVSLKTETIEQYSSATLGDALKEIGGVSSLNTGSNIVKPSIHGLSGSRVLILNDGVRMQDMEWGDEHAPNVDINSAGTISVIKGASALQYGGDAIGGVIIMDQQITTLRDTLYGKTLLNGMTNGRGGNVSTGRFEWQGDKHVQYESAMVWGFKAG